MNFVSLHELLRSTYQEMVPLYGEVTGVVKGIAGLGALFYVAVRMWSPLSRVEPTDLFPLLRPFVLGLCTMFFPAIVLGTMNTVLSPVVQGIKQMINKRTIQLDKLIAKHDKLQEAVYLRDSETAYLVSNEAFDQKVEKIGIIGPSDAVTIAGMYAEHATYKTKQWLMKRLHDLIELLYHAVAPIIGMLRAFFPIMLNMLGPTVSGVAVWNDLSGSLTIWFFHYVSVYLWLLVSSIFSVFLTKIQVLTVQKDTATLSGPNHLSDPGSWYYIVLFLTGIVGYFCVPMVAGWIVKAGGDTGAYGRNVD